MDFNQLPLFHTQEHGTAAGSSMMDLYMLVEKSAEDQSVCKVKCFQLLAVRLRHIILPQITDNVGCEPCSLYIHTKTLGRAAL